MMNNDSTLRVLYILDGFPDPSAGTEGQFWTLLNSLDRKRISPSMVLLADSSFIAENLRAVPKRVLGTTRLSSVVTWARAVRATIWARRQGVRIAHIFFNDCSILFPALLRLFGIRVIVSRRDLGFWYTTSNLLALRAVAPLIDVVVANCDAVKCSVVEHERVAPDRVHVIYNGISKQWPAAEPRTKREFAIPDGAPVVAVIANLRPLKRIGDAIRAIAMVDSSGQLPPHLVVVGADRACAAGKSHLADLLEVARHAGVEDRVHFVGKMLDPFPVIQLADICMLCSESEGLSNAIIEYMLAGKPVIATNTGGNPELVVDGETGRIVPVGDVTAIGLAISSLLKDPELGKAWGNVGRKRAETLYSKERMVEQHTQLYEGLARGCIVASESNS